MATRWQKKSDEDRHRESLALTIAQVLGSQFDLKRTDWDETRAANIITNFLPDAHMLGQIKRYAVCEFADKWERKSIEGITNCIEAERVGKMLPPFRCSMCCIRWLVDTHFEARRLFPITGKTGP